MYKKNLKRGICASLCFFQLLALQSYQHNVKANDQGSVAMTQEKIDKANNAYNDAPTTMEFITMSDTEFMAKPENAQDSQKVNVQQHNYLYERIATWAKEKDFDVDAIMVNGDVVGANEAEYNEHQKGNDTMVQGWYRAFDQVITQNFGEDVPVVLSSGNHDIADLMGETFDENHKEDATWFYGNKESEYVGNVYTQINGYDFITLDYNGKTTFGYGGQRKGYQDFLKQTLSTITSSKTYDASKPIFIQAHSGYAGTSLGGEFHSDYDTMGNDLQTILKDYPQAVVFSAHTHFSVEMETAIYQKNLTFVENGSMNYMYLDTPNDFVEGGYFNSNTGNNNTTERTCNFISVLEDGTTLVRRYDVSNQRWIGMPWIIDTTKGKDGFTYTDDKRSTIAPWFDETSKVTMQTIADTSATLNFTQAMDDELVNYYEINIKDMTTNQPVPMRVRQLPDKSNTAYKSFTNSFKAYSRFYYRPNTMEFDIQGLQPHRTYQVSITAVDDFENKSTLPLTSTFKTTGVITLPSIDGSTSLPENINDNKYLEMSFEGTLQDNISHTASAQASGNVSYTKSYHENGQAIRIGNKKSDYVDLGNREEWNLGSDKDISINFWINVTSQSGYSAILSNKNWSNYYKKGINIAPQSSNTSKLEFTFGDDTNGVYSTSDVENFKGSWHMMSFTIDRETQKMRSYFDGVLTNEVSIENIKDATSKLNMILGSDGSKSYGTIGFDMDDLTMWSRSLTSEDIQAIYNVSRNYESEIQLAVSYGKELLEDVANRIEQGYVYDESIVNNVKDCIQKAQEDTSSMNMYRSLKEAIETLQAQPNVYKVSASAIHGSITPTSTQVTQGEILRFICTPQDGYILDEQQINLQGASSFTIEGNDIIIQNVQNAIYLEVTFVKEESKEDDETSLRTLQDGLVQIEGIFHKDSVFKATLLSNERIQTYLTSIDTLSNVQASNVVVGYDMTLTSVQKNASNAINVQIQVPSERTSKLRVLQINEDHTTTWLDYKVEGNRVQFSTSQLSTFLIIQEQDTISKIPDSETKKTSTSVNTFDETDMPIVWLVMSLCVIVYCIDYKRRKAMK